MPLNDITERAIDLNTSVGVTNTGRAVKAMVSLLKTAEPSDQDDAFEVCARKMIHDKATREFRQAAKGDVRQGSFFSLRSRYALETDHRVIKDTERLTRLEWQSILTLRRKQLRDDAAQLAILEAVNSELAPIWDEYPAKLYGEIEAIYRRRQEAA